MIYYYYYQYYLAYQFGSGEHTQFGTGGCTQKARPVQGAYPQPREPRSKQGTQNNQYGTNNVQKKPILSDDQLACPFSEHEVQSLIM